MTPQPDATTCEAQRLANYQRALDAEPRLRPIVAVVDALCALVRRTDQMCYGCAWDGIVKPLVNPYLGYGRGWRPREASDPEPVVDGARRSRPVSLTKLLADKEARVPATTDTEKWLRTPEAWDAFTDVLLARLKQADPAHGHGIGRRQRERCRSEAPA
jgi:hypothetical protein